jgi:hypothetical protein
MFFFFAVSVPVAGLGPCLFALYLVEILAFLMLDFPFSL